MNRSSTLQRRTPLRRKTRPAPVGKKGRRDRSELAAVRPTVMLRSEGLCEARLPGCTGYGEHLHHVRRRSQGGDNSAENLLNLCSSCHCETHRNVGRSITLGLLSPRPVQSDGPPSPPPSPSACPDLRKVRRPGREIRNEVAS